MKKNIVTGCFILVCSAAAYGGQPLANFSHLDHLMETILMDGDSVSIVHIYANYPAYGWIDAKESGPEGIACVDDAARAAVVLLRHYELTKDARSLRKAKSLLGFVMKMQADDGRFYNFILADHSINRTGTTSFKSFGWWASRAVWSLSSAYRILKSADARYADRCRQSVERTFPYIDTLLARYGRSGMKKGYRTPEWLLYSSGADVTSELLLGLVEYSRAAKSARVKKYIAKLSDGVMMMQDGGWTEYPYGMHRSWETQWHAWGNGQTQALSSAAMHLKMPILLRSAEREAASFYSRLLVYGLMKETDLAIPGKKIVYEQIAYGVRPMAVGLLRLYEATHDETYLKMAGLAASWFFGNNIIRQTMYDTATGRCFDGITDSVTVNRNSGAESTVEALYVMVELDRYPALRKYLDLYRTRSYSDAGREVALFGNARGERAALIVDTEKKTVTLLEGADAVHFIDAL